MASFKAGFWADHWTYYIELIESYLAIYPDWEERIMYNTELPYFYSPAFVKPRSDKYVLSTNFEGTGKHVRQLDAVDEADKEKLLYEKRFLKNTTGWYDFAANWQHDTSDNVFYSSPIGKLFLLATMKFVTRDPYGMGIEYEAGRPGWDDANNGLVGMLGSGMPETYELIVLIKYILSTVYRLRREIPVPTELDDLLRVVESEIKVLKVAKIPDLRSMHQRVPQAYFDYWDAVSTAREKVSLCTKRIDCYRAWRTAVS
jgi:hypothetical protein